MKPQWIKTQKGGMVDITGCHVNMYKKEGVKCVFAWHLACDNDSPLVELFNGTESECQEYIMALACDSAAREWDSELKQFVIVAGIKGAAQE